MVHPFPNRRLAILVRRAVGLESDSAASPKARFRFGFSGKRNRNIPNESTRVSSDDILDSLTRQAASQLGFQEQHTQSLEVLADEDEPTLSAEPVFSAETPFSPVGRRKLGHYVIVVVGGAGLVVVWLYGSVKGLIGTAFLDSILQRMGVHSIFANPAQVGIISLAALLTSVWIAVRRRRARLLFHI